MTSRRLAALATLMVVLPACATTQGTSSAEPNQAVRTAATSSPSIDSPAPTARLRGARKARKITVRVLPQIAQPGSRPAKAGKAKNPILVNVVPRRRSAAVLQVKAGRKWKRVDAATTSKRGAHVFLAPAKRGGKAATYRVKVGKKKSAAQSTQPWRSAKFTDNFTGRTLSSAWEHRKQFFEPASSRACSRGAQKAVKVKGGTLRLSVLKDKAQGSKKCVAVSDGKRGKFDYRLNGHISTESSMRFKYGFAAARIRFPKAQGQHGSFWLQPADEDRGDALSRTLDPKETGAEIDIIESFGANAGPKDSLGLSSFTYHWARDGEGQLTGVKTGGYLRHVKKRALRNKKDNVHRNYHVYSVEWTPTSYIFRIDGKETYRSSQGVSGLPQYAILSMLSSDWELGRASKKVAQHMHVDWMRVWETGGS